MSIKCWLNEIFTKRITEWIDINCDQSGYSNKSDKRVILFHFIYKTNKDKKSFLKKEDIQHHEPLTKEEMDFVNLSTPYILSLFENKIDCEDETTPKSPASRTFIDFMPIVIKNRENHIQTYTDMKNQILLHKDKDIPNIKTEQWPLLIKICFTIVDVWRLRGTTTTITNQISNDTNNDRNLYKNLIIDVLDIIWPELCHRIFIIEMIDTLIQLYINFRNKNHIGIGK